MMEVLATLNMAIINRVEEVETKQGVCQLQKKTHQEYEQNKKIWAQNEDKFSETAFNWESCNYFFMSASNGYFSCCLETKVV